MRRLKTNRKPRIGSFILDRIIPENIKAAFMGDLEEAYIEKYRTDGRLKAVSWYWIQVIKTSFDYLMSMIIRSNSMFKNYLQIAYRNIRKNPGISFLNITGFAVGIAFSGLLFLWIFDELSYDSYHEKADQIYRIYSCVGEEPSILSPPALAPAMKAAYPEVLAATRIFDSWGTARVEYGEKAFIEPELYFSDSTIFEVLTLPIIKGNEKNALNKPNTAIITGSIAEKYFGDAEPIDKVLQVNGKPYRVTAIVKEAPNNSHFHYDLICNDGSNDSKWYSYMYTYVLLPKGYHKSKMESKLDKLVEEIIGPQMKDLKGISHEEYISSGKKWEYRLQQITDIHLNSGLLYELEPGGNLNYVYVLFCSGILIFIAACLNYISIATASSIKRAKEVSLRKVFGSKKRNIVGQFLSESTLLCGISVLLSILIIELALPAFNNYTGKAITIPYLDSVFTLPIIALIIITMGIISGWYPAFYVSSFTPVNIIKGEMTSGKGKSFFQNSLVTVQLTVSLTVIIGAIIVFRQIEFISGKDLGFDRENVLVVEKSTFRVSQKDAYIQELMKNPDILNVSFSDNDPGEGLLISMHYPEGADMSTGKNLNIIRTDHNFMQTLDLKLKYGRSFSREIESDSYEVILNEKAVNDLGIKDPIGKRILGYDPQSPNKMVPKEIIGVLEDFHFASLHTAIKPFMIERVLDDFTEKLLIRIRSDNISGTIEYIDETAKRFDPEDIYNYQFLDDKINALYDLDRKMSEAFIVFSVITIFIGCLGLFGLIFYTCQQKQREVSIRKVLGATGMKIVYMYSMDLLILIAVASTIAAPVTYFIMKNWLSNFAYQIDMTITPFVTGSVIICVVVMVTVFVHILRSALVNPVDSLRHE